MLLGESVQRLETAWSDEDGFLFQLRMGKFDGSKAESLVATLKDIEPGEAEPVARRAVSLLWYLPLFIGWQQERVDQKDVKALERVEVLVTNELERILGVP